MSKTKSNISIFYLLIIYFTIFFNNINSFSQRDSSIADFGGIIYLDSFVVTASKKKFNVDDFIQLIQEDESFYIAFRNLRFMTYAFDNNIEFFSKKNKTIANYKSKAYQESVNQCRTMNLLSEKYGGKYFKKKRKHRFYTARMYEKLFYTRDTICESEEISIEDPNAKGMDKYIRELKKLIFKPGKEVDVPIIGKKTAIFDKKMTAYYYYSITSKQYNGKIDCYVFTATVRPEFQQKQKDKTVIKFLETYFDKNTFQVIARNYVLSYSSALFDFDIKMKIKLKKIGDKYIPEFISYDGFWNLPFKKPEVAKFQINFFDFR